ncbi:MAG: hypothetical protein CMP22_00935 [Rickettsiales bacterium]|nr:hypothetical protein [Rickettsiales bacterium]|tara:strand:+ start:106 stop:516 length:411 start_codon:yes stop_codon:yes gene_type:complete
MIADIFVFLYPVVVLISIAGYLPQIKSLITATSEPDNISIHSWYIWGLSAFLTLGYGLSHLNDFMFNLTAAINFGFVAFTTILIYYNMHFRFSDSKDIVEKVKDIKDEIRVDLKDVVETTAYQADILQLNESQIEA